MTFTNVTLDLNSLPRLVEVKLHELHPSYARVVLGVALMFQIPVFIGVSVLLFAVLVPKAGMPLLAAIPLLAVILLLFAFLAWFTYQSACVMRYALREHDVIFRSGVFWKQETVQPIRRIQHVEQHQGPIDKRFGLYELKLFSAGTGHFTFRVPGLDEDSASRIRQFILNVQEDGWQAGTAPVPVSDEANPVPDV
jgi:membrane protein YdbS with pleckstrin-like domain